MGIIHIAGASVWGGGEQYVYDINAEMQRRGKDVYVLVDESNAVLCSRFAETAEIVPAKLYKGRGIASLFSTARFMKKRRIGLIACHSGKYILTALLLKKLTGAKVLFFKHN
ncbi:MAG: glycosyltransferase family 1 protein, partial [Anaeroglobus sp.]|nr:glycosyltransferase family 1 protein [Anaeroglobus sp.]